MENETKEYKTPTYVRKAINNYQKKKREDKEYMDKLQEYKRLYMRNYRLKHKQIVISAF